MIGDVGPAGRPGRRRIRRPSLPEHLRLHRRPARRVRPRLYLATLRAGAVYEHTYLLGTSMARPVIASGRRACAAAWRDGFPTAAPAKATTKCGLRLAYKAIAPNVRIIAPWREWDIDSREVRPSPTRENTKFPWSRARKHLQPRPATSRHLSHEGGELEDPANAPNEAMWQWVVSPEQAPDKADEVEIGFEAVLRFR